MDTGGFKDRSGLGNTRGRAREVYFERNLSQTGDRRISQYHKYGLQKVSGLLDTSCFLGHSCFKKDNPIYMQILQVRAKGVAHILILKTY